jgi:Outer membrane lipoprotein carrier protein LolA
MRVSRRSVLAGSVALLAARVARAAGSIDDLLARIAKARVPVRTLQGPFTQTRTIGLLSTDVRSTGTLALVRPDRLRWQLAAPDDVTFWIGPEGLAYRSAHGQGRLPATSAQIAAALQDLHALLGGDLSRLRDRWALSVIRDDATGAELEATARPGVPPPGDKAPPEGSAAVVARRMRFALGPDLVRPTHALLVQGEHDRTTIDFGDLVVNASIDESTMRPPS